jgi:protein-arginine deiminase
MVRSRALPYGVLVSLCLALHLVPACSSSGDGGPDPTDVRPGTEGLRETDVPSPSDGSQAAADAGDGGCVEARSDAVGELVDPPLEPRLDLATDADRDGEASFTDPRDEELEESWSLEGGAVFLHNGDDDDGDGVADCEDAVVNGSEDLADLAPVRIAAAPWLPADAEVTLAVENGHLVRLFLLSDGGWIPGDGGALSWSGADLAAGPVTLGLEGRDVAAFQSPDPEQRTVRLVLTARDAAGSELARDVAVLRHAPLLVASALNPVQEVWTLLDHASQVPFVAALGAVLDGAGIPLRAWGSVGEPLGLPALSPQPWLEDALLVLFAVLPGTEGHTVMHYVLSGEGGEAFQEALTKVLLGPGCAPVGPVPDGGDGGPSAAFSRLAVSPVLLAGEMYFPYGKLYVGVDPSRGGGPLGAVLALLARQEMQMPVVELDTSALHSGRVGEILAWVPYTDDPGCCGKGFRTLFADPGLGVTLLAEWVAAGHGEAAFFGGTETAITVAALLEDADFVAFNEGLAETLEAVYLQAALAFGLEEEDIIRVPALFLPDEVSGRAVPFFPSSLDSLVAGNHFLAPLPMGPVVGGTDLIGHHLQTLLDSINAAVTLVEVPHPWPQAAPGAGFGGLGRATATRRKPHNLEWWLWTM